MLPPGYMKPAAKHACTGALSFPVQRAALIVQLPFRLRDMHACDVV